MNGPLVSCIVPTFNGEQYLAETLDSILGQTHRPIEVIVVDDGSTDGTAGLIAQYGGRVRALCQTNAGIAAARNRGVSAARGELVAFLDHDDVWHAEKLARQVRRFAARPELDLCVAHAQNFWGPELREEAERFQNHRRGGPVPGYIPGTLLARRALFQRLGAFDPRRQHADHTDWFLRAAEVGAVMELLPDVLTYRRIHRTNFSRLTASESRLAYLLLVKASLDRRRGGGVPMRYEFPAPLPQRPEGSDAIRE